MRRRVNEDAWGHRDQIFVVADGMGGRGGGALAARTAVDRFLARSPRRARSTGATSSPASTTTSSGPGPTRGIDRLGTTLLAAVVGGPLVTLVHLGDSRAYRLTRSPTTTATGSTC